MLYVKCNEYTSEIPIIGNLGDQRMTNGDWVLCNQGDLGYITALLIPTTHKDVISLKIFYFEGTKPTMLQLCGILQTFNVNWMVGISDYLCNGRSVWV